MIYAPRRWKVWRIRYKVMAKVYVLQTGRTTWEEQSRIESVGGSPLTDSGVMAVEEAARELADCKIKAVYACAAGQAERQTAKLVAKALSAKVRESRELHELDYGLWQGLTVDEIKRRQPKAYRQWTKAPTSICPPEGETLDEAQDRLRAALKNILKRSKNTPALLVLRPVAAGLLKCLTEKQGAESVWQYVDESFRWGCYEVDDKSL